MRRLNSVRCTGRAALVLVYALFAVTGLALLGLPAAALAQNLDIGGYQIVQANSSATYTVPDGTTIAPGGYLVLGRFASQSAFESFYGVSLGSNVIYVTNDATSPVVPMINGDETYSLYTDTGTLIDGPTPEFDSSNDSHHRTDPEASPWTADNDTATPGFGVESPDAVYSGLVITEATNAAGTGNYIYEFVEIYYDADGGGTGNNPPVISGVSHDPEEPAGGDDVTVSATIIDYEGTVDDARCFYRFDGGTYSNVIMSHVGGNVYSTTLSSVPSDVTLEYYLLAEDDEGETSLSPSAAPTTVYSVWIPATVSPGKVILFDHGHDQDAGSAGNWRIDDSYPDPYPTNPSSETSWNGQLSSWGYELYLAGHTVRSLTSTITTSALAGVDLFVIPEPQDPFTASEIEAVRQFVYDGGSLFFIADHNSSDRNNNGWDSPSIFGGYSVPHISDPVGSDTETFCGALFGLHVHVKDEGDNAISGSYTNVNSDPTNPVIHGDYGAVSELYYHVGNVMSLWPSANPYLDNVGGLVSKDGGSPHLAAWSEYGSGRVVGYGDSSSMADGTGSESHEDNWHEASHRAFFLNASLWLLVDDASPVYDTPAPFGLGLRTYPNPFNPQTTVSLSLPADASVQVQVFDLAGRLLRTLHDGPLAAGDHQLVWNGRSDDGRVLPSGVYLVRAGDGATVAHKKVVLAK